MKPKTVWAVGGIHGRLCEGRLAELLDLYAIPYQVKALMVLHERKEKKARKKK